MSEKGSPRARLRRSDCSGEGIRRRRRGRGFSFEDARRAADRGRGDPGADPRARRSRRPGKRSGSAPIRCGHIQATGLDVAGRKQYRYHDRWELRRAARKYEEMREFARRAAALAPCRRPRHRPRGDAPRAGAGLRRAAARPRLLPDRRRGVRGDQRELRAGDAAARARHGRRARRWSSTSPPRAASGGCSRSATRARSPPSRRCAAAAAAPTTCSPTARAAAGKTSAPTDVNAYIQEKIGEDFSAKDFRTWSGTVLAAVALAGEPSRIRGRRQAHDRRRRQERRRGPRQHAGGLPPLLHRPPRLRPLPRRGHDRARRCARGGEMSRAPPRRGSSAASSS